MMNRQELSRPEWALFAKSNQDMETILFREKFFDWPDPAQLIKTKVKDLSLKEVVYQIVLL